MSWVNWILADKAGGLGTSKETWGESERQVQSMAMVGGGGRMRL